MSREAGAAAGLPPHPLLDGAVIRPSGEAAFAVEFGDRIDPRLAERARALAAALDAARPEGLRETVPTHRSVLVIHDPDLDDPLSILAALPEGAAAAGPEPARWRVPVCLEGAAAEDLAEAASLLGLAPDDLRARLLASDLRVAMYGFAPGLAYLSGVDPAATPPRRASPRRPMPAGSLIAAAGQAALASVSMPTGWYVLGRAAVRMFDPAGSPPVPFAPGDRIALRAVSEDALAALPPSGGVERLA